MGSPLFEFGFGRFILQDIPVFGETAILDSDNIRGDPVSRSGRFLTGHSVLRVQEAVS